MDQSPVVREFIDRGARILAEFDPLYPITVAYWLKNADESSWHLYIASPKLQDSNIGAAYGEVHRIVNQMTDTPFDPMYIKLRKTDDPMVQYVFEFQRRYPGRFVIASDVPTFYGVEVDGVYLYPPAKSAAA
jgi:hypothetical protein